jgi:hypothetical protein
MLLNRIRNHDLNVLGGRTHFLPYTERPLSSNKQSKNSMVLVRWQTLQTERLTLVCEVSTNFCG